LDATTIEFVFETHSTTNYSSAALARATQSSASGDIRRMFVRRCSPRRSYNRAVPEAVIFDLFDTLVDYDDTRSRQFSAAAAELLGRERDEFHRAWREGATYPRYRAACGLSRAARHRW
jgi:hypothetical protein